MKTEWLEGIERGDVARLGHLLNAGADVNARDRYGQTGLMIAARRGKADVLRLLIDRGAALDQTGKFGLSAVMLAVILLLEADADPRIRTRIDECETPREMAEKAGDREIAQMLASHDERR